MLEAQSFWLSSARSRLLRRAAIARRQSVLDLGAGYGLVTAELARRCGGRVVGLDREFSALAAFKPPDRTGLACGLAASLPFPDCSFDLVFSQCALMWMDAPAVIREIHRVMKPGGVLAAVEPDYGGMIEYPEAIALGPLWQAGLEASGADPCLGRKLPGLLAECGLNHRVELIPEIHPPAAERYSLLAGLPLSAKQLLRLKKAELAEQSLRENKIPAVVHLPFFLVIAVKGELTSLAG